MAFGRDKVRNDLKKAIYKAIAKAYKQNIPFVKEAVDSFNKEHAVNHIIADIEDPNNVAEVPENHIPVDKDNVLHKDVPSVKEMHDAKEAQAKAKMNIMPAAGQKGAVYMSEKPEKGAFKLRKFLGERELKMEKARIDEGKSREEKSYARWKRAGDQTEGVHTAPFKSVPGMSTSGYEIEIAGHPTEAAKESHKRVLSELKQMPKPDLGKANLDQKGVHPSVNTVLDKPNPKLAGRSIAGLSGKENEIREHKKVLSELKQMPKPDLGKARADEGLSLEDKVRARQERNIRNIRDARTPTGQKTRTARSSRRRESELELGTPHYSNFDEHGRPMRVHSVPSERRHGEKIVGEPKEMSEREGGVHIRGATYAPKHQNIGGGGSQSMGAMSEKGGKSWRSGGKYHTYGGSRLAHEDVMHAQSKIRPNLPKSEEMSKEESKHDRCVKEVEESSPEVRNPHAVCISRGVTPRKWKK